MVVCTEREKKGVILVHNQIAARDIVRGLKKDGDDGVWFLVL